MSASIGDLNKRLTIFPQQRVSNGAGGWTVNKGAPFIVWAKMRQLTAREIIRYQANENEIDTIIETRYLEAITEGSTCQLKERGKTRNFVIIGPPLDEKMEFKWLTIRAREVF